MFLHKKTKKTVVRSLRTKFLAVFVVAVLCVTSVFAATVSAYTVTIYDGDTALSIRTSAQAPSEILAQAGVDVGEEDSLDLSAFVSGENSSITVKRAFPVTIVDADEEVKVMTTKETVSELLTHTDIQVGAKDILSHEPNEYLTPNMRLQIRRTFPVTVIENGETSVVHVTPGSVGTSLHDIGVTLDQYDKITPAKNELMRPGMVIHIDRVENTYRSETEKIPFSVIKTDSDSLEIGQTKKVQDGRTGEKVIVYKDSYANGKLLSTSIVSETVSQEPVDEKWLIGTKKPVSADNGGTTSGSTTPSTGGSNAAEGAISTLTPPDWLMIDENGVPNKYRYILRGESTAYYEPKGNLTATGKKVRLGYIAVDPREIPYGTEMYIVSEDGKYVYGYCIAADTGGFIYNSDTICDLYFDSERKCYEFGRRDVIIYVL